MHGVPRCISMHCESHVISIPKLYVHLLRSVPSLLAILASVSLGPGGIEGTVPKPQKYVHLVGCSDLLSRGPAMDRRKGETKVGFAHVQCPRIHFAESSRGSKSSTTGL
jgi:hypothetical protein